MREQDATLAKRQDIRHGCRDKRHTIELPKLVVSALQPRLELFSASARLPAHRTAHIKAANPAIQSKPNGNLSEP